MSRFSTDDTELVMPDIDQIARLAGGKGRICGECKHWEHGAAQRDIAKTRFLETVVREYGWKLQHLGSDPLDLGFCGEYVGGDQTKAGYMLCGRYANAVTCESFRPANGGFSLVRKDRS